MSITDFNYLFAYNNYNYRKFTLNISKFFILYLVMKGLEGKKNMYTRLIISSVKM